MVASYRIPNVLFWIGVLLCVAFALWASTGCTPKAGDRPVYNPPSEKYVFAPPTTMPVPSARAFADAPLEQAGSVATRADRLMDLADELFAKLEEHDKPTAVALKAEAKAIRDESWSLENLIRVLISRIEADLSAALRIAIERDEARQIVREKDDWIKQHLIEDWKVEQKWRDAFSDAGTAAREARERWNRFIALILAVSGVSAIILGVTNGIISQWRNIKSSSAIVLGGIALLFLGLGVLWKGELMGGYGAWVAIGSFLLLSGAALWVWTRETGTWKKVSESMSRGIERLHREGLITDWESAKTILAQEQADVSGYAGAVVKKVSKDFEDFEASK